MAALVSPDGQMLSIQRDTFSDVPFEVKPISTFDPILPLSKQQGMSFSGK